MTSFPITTRLFFIIPTPLPSALFELDADTSVFIYLFPFLRYKLKRECVAMQTRFLNSGGNNSSSAESHVSQLCIEINHIFEGHIVLTKELKMFI